MSARVCRAEGCATPARKRGTLCARHNSRMARHGDFTTDRRAAETPSYPAQHHRLRKQRGAASQHCCAFLRCGQQAHHWSYDGSGIHSGDEITDGKRIWSANPDRYWPLCRRHHGAFDRAMRAFRAALAEEVSA